ncbi:MAG: phosphatase PAP2 family protein, partial [Mycobacteriales bacterium]
MSLDSRWYLVLNRFARSTGWAHPFMRGYALYDGVVLLGLLLVLGWWSARGTGRPDLVARALWAAVGTVVAVGLSQPLNHAVARPRPYNVLANVEVLVPRANDFSFPSDHAVVAGAVIAGLWLAHRTRLAIVASVAGLFLAFARVYAGAHYPGDVAGGLVFGAAVVLVLAVAAVPLLTRLCLLLARTPLRPLV